MLSCNRGLLTYLSECSELIFPCWWLTEQNNAAWRAVRPESLNPPYNKWHAQNRLVSSLQCSTTLSAANGRQLVLPGLPFFSRKTADVIHNQKWVWAHTHTHTHNLGYISKWHPGELPSNCQATWPYSIAYTSIFFLNVCIISCVPVTTVVESKVQILCCRTACGAVRVWGAAIANSLWK